MDVNTTFLNGVIEEVYIEQPDGFVIHGKEPHVCRLKKALYGLKQAPRAWYERIDRYLMSLGFSKNDANSNLYFKVINGETLILVLYVDDLFFTGEEHLIVKCKELASEFEMKEFRSYALLSRIGGVAKTQCDYSKSREIHHRYLEEIRNDGLQIYVYTNGNKFEEIE